MSVVKSRAGVDGLGGEGGVGGRFLSADWALFDTNWAGTGTVLVRFGEPHRLGPEGVDGGVGDLYRELTSLVFGRRVTPLHFSAGTNGRLEVSTAVCFCNAFSASHTSIHTIQIRPH